MVPGSQEETDRQTASPSPRPPPQAVVGGGFSKTELRASAGAPEPCRTWVKTGAFSSFFPS